uniref:Uncharacterized protein n=1 Tax=Heterorhabditis bacteriophora TaxID=37862 RepID=A0A1I7WIC2_HETBA
MVWKMRFHPFNLSVAILRIAPSVGWCKNVANIT